MRSSCARAVVLVLALNRFLSSAYVRASDVLLADDACESIDGWKVRVDLTHVGAEQDHARR